MPHATAVPQVVTGVVCEVQYESRLDSAAEQSLQLLHVKV
jgi:hypothetical protein